MSAMNLETWELLRGEDPDFSAYIFKLAAEESR
jgi:hypothetical protein